MARRALSSCRQWCLPTTMFLLIATAAHGVSLDDNGSIKLGVRTYTAARIGTQDTDQQICYGIGATYKCGTQNAHQPG